MGLVQMCVCVLWLEVLCLFFQGEKRANVLARAWLFLMFRTFEYVYFEALFCQVCADV
jgi:hypothetical protein